MTRWMAPAALTLLLVGGCTSPKDKARYQQAVERLGSKDGRLRAMGAENAGTVRDRSLGAKLVPILIGCLDPKKEQETWVSIYAAASLGRLTGQDFGSEQRSHARWNHWWNKEARGRLPKRRDDPKDFMKRTQAGVLNDRGKYQLTGGNYVSARNLFQKAIELDGTNPEYHSNLGLALLEQGMHDWAEQRFDDAIAVDKNYILAYLNKGTVHFDKSVRLRAKAKEHAAAAESHRAAGERAEELKERARMVKVLQKVGAAEEKALDIYRHALSTDKRDRLWSAHAYIGRIHMQRGDYEKAIGPLERARELEPGDILVHSNLALIYFGLDQYYRAWKEIRAVEDLGGEMDPGFTEKVKGKVKGMLKEKS